jgi:hypothetical protein
MKCQAGLLTLKTVYLVYVMKSMFGIVIVIVV